MLRAQAVSTAMIVAQYDGFTASVTEQAPIPWTEDDFFLSTPSPHLSHVVLTSYSIFNSNNNEMTIT